MSPQRGEEERALDPEDRSRALLVDPLEQIQGLFVLAQADVDVGQVVG